MGRRRRDTEADTRPLPWVTYAMLCGLLLGFVYAQTEAIEIDALSETKLSSAAEFFQAHPYLELPAILESRVNRSAAQRLAREFEVKRYRTMSVPLPAGLVAREQLELDEMVWFVAMRLEGRPERAFGLWSAAPAPFAFVSHVFFHAGVAHFLIGAFLFLLLGHHLERAWGSAGMLGVVAVSGFASAGVFILQQSTYSEPLIGSFGVVAGLLGAYAVSAARAGHGVRYAAALLFGGAGLFAPAWLGFEWSIARGFGAEPALPGGFNPSLWAVIGGFASGAMVAGAAAAFGRRIAAAPVEPEPQQSSAQAADLDRAIQDRRAGNTAEAFRRLESILRRDPAHLEASLAFWEVSNDLGRPDAAVPFLLRVLRGDVRQNNVERAVHYWLELVRCKLDDRAEPALLLRMASLLRTAEEEPVAVRALRFAIQGADESNMATVASRVAREAQTLDPELAVEAAWKALGCGDIDLEERQALEALIARATAFTGTPAREQPKHAPGAEYRPAVVERAAQRPGPAPGPEPAGVAIALDQLERELELVEAQPLALDESGLLIEAGGGRKRVRYDRVQAVAVAAVEGISSKPVIVVDLLLNWQGSSAEPLKVIRMRTDRFDPRRLIENKRDPLEAVRAFTKRLARETSATPLPDYQSICGLPFAAFKTLHQYHRDVLLVDDDEGDE